jgi:hypothetical protein
MGPLGSAMVRRQRFFEIAGRLRLDRLDVELHSRTLDAVGESRVDREPGCHQILYRVSKCLIFWLVGSHLANQRMRIGRDTVSLHYGRRRLPCPQLSERDNGEDETEYLSVISFYPQAHAVVADVPAEPSSF